MALQILPPEKAKANARAKVRKFQLEKKRAEVEGKGSPILKSASETTAKKLTPEEQKQLDGKLWNAAHIGNKKEAKRLIKAGAQTNVETDWEGCTALDAAVINRKFEIVELFIEESAISVTDALMSVSRYGGGRWIARSLIERGADINARDDTRWTVLIRAIRNEQTEIARVLVDAGANLDWRYGNGQTPLMAAVDRGNIEVAQILIEAGINVNAKSFSKCTALRFAAQEGQMRIVRMLIEAGADVNVKDEWGGTALDRAIDAKQMEIAKFLKTKGAKQGDELQ
ncbi:MAG: ankyrin repeat domain-containing protein [bacterium]|nr:ankyrin repeat domain-containing protein [bacterium]